MYNNCAKESHCGDLYLFFTQTKDTSYCLFQYFCVPLQAIVFNEL